MREHLPSREISSHCQDRSALLVIDPSIAVHHPLPTARKPLMSLAISKIQVASCYFHLRRLTLLLLFLITDESVKIKLFVGNLK
jgi:hypothetical protein